MIFRQGDHGWSEDLYGNWSTLAAAKSALTTLVPLRMACSTPDVVFQDVRVKDMSTNFHVQTYLPSDLSMSSGVGTFVNSISGGSQLAAPNDVCAFIKVSDNAFNNTVIRVHGIPLVSLGGEDVFVRNTGDASLNTAFNAYEAALASSCVIKTRGIDAFTSIVNYAADTKIHYRKTGRPLNLPVGRDKS